MPHASTPVPPDPSAPPPLRLIAPCDRSSDPELQQDMTDAALVAAALDGDQDACAAIVRRHHATCWRYAYRMLGHRQDAEDVVQETFFRAFRSLPSYREEDRFRAWLFRILANQCRTAAVRRHRTGGWIPLHDADAPARTDQPIRVLERREIADALQRALETLGPKYREAFLLKYGEEMEYGEMSRVTGVGVSALKMRVKRACDLLRPALREMGYGED